MGHRAFDWRCRSWCIARLDFESTGLSEDRNRAMGGGLSKSVADCRRGVEAARVADSGKVNGN
jgi:hypothetical protein